MSSADRWRVLLPSRISRIFRRGSVTFRPALRRSLPSTRSLLAGRGSLRRATGPRSGIIRAVIILQRTDMRPLFAALLLTTTLAGCVYRLDIQQGNFLEGKTVDRLQVGMTRSQVRYLLGTPMVPDIFNKDRWDYLYYFVRGRLRAPDQRHVAVFFKDDKVQSFVRDNVPESAPQTPDQEAPISKFPKI